MSMSIQWRLKIGLEAKGCREEGRDGTARGWIRMSDYLRPTENKWWLGDRGAIRYGSARGGVDNATSFTWGRERILDKLERDMGVRYGRS